MPERSITYEFRAKFDSFKANLAAGGKSVDDFGKKLLAVDRNGEQMRRGLTDLGNLGGKIGLGAAAGLALAAKAAIDWETAFAGVEKTVNGTASELAALEGELRGLAQTMPATHAEIAGVAEAAGQLGVATEDVAAFTETMVQLGETTNLSAEDAATSIAQMSNVMRTAPEDIGRVGAALVALGNDGASTEAEIVGMAQKIAGAGAQIGLAESDILAIANAASSMGIEVEAGGTAISRVFTDMAKATSQGGEDLDAFAKVAGTSSQEFSRLFGDDPASAFAAFTAGLNRINQSGGDVFTTLEQLGLSDVRVSQALLGMAASGDLLTDSLALGAQAWDENTALTDEYGKRVDTTAAQVQIAWNQIKDAAIDAGAVLLPVVSQAASVVGDLASAFGDLPGPVQSSVTGLLGITAVLGGGLWFTSKVVNGIVSTNRALSDLGIQSKITRGSLVGLAKGLGIAALLYGAAAGSRALMDSTKEAAPNVEKLTAALIDADTAALESEFGASISDALDVLDTNKFEDIGDAMADLSSRGGVLGETLFAGLGGAASQDLSQRLEEAAEAFGSLDSALTDLVSSGGPERAREAFDALAESQGLSGSQREELLKQLPAYESALQDAANSADLEAEATEGAGDAAAQATPKQERLAEALREQRGANQEAAEGFYTLAEAVKKPTLTLDDLMTRMRRQAEATRDIAANMNKAIENGADPAAIKRVYDELGTESALAFEQLAGGGRKAAKAFNAAFGESENATNRLFRVLNRLTGVLDGLDGKKVEPKMVLDDKAFIGSTNAAEHKLNGLDKWRPEPTAELDTSPFDDSLKAAEQGAHAFGRIREMATVDANTAPAISSINALEHRMNTIDDEVVNITTYHRNVNIQTNQKNKLAADGDTVPDDGGPYSDRYPYLLAPREEVVSNRYGGADMNRAELKAASRGAKLAVVRGMADGGTAGHWARGERRVVHPGRGGSAMGPQVVEHRVTVVGALDARQAVAELRQEMHEVSRSEIDQSATFDRQQRGE